uniref:WD repeat-containing protein 38-like n=1 Tax=Scleropages formosus TaxID=113540 RepID=A0A8C9VU72_SCLFO
MSKKYPEELYQNRSMRKRKPDNLMRMVNCCAFSPDCHILLTCSDDSRLHLWSAQSGQLLAKAKGHTGPVKCCTFSPDCALFASASHDRSVRLWSSATITLDQSHRRCVETVRFSPDGMWLVSGGWDKQAILWDVQSGEIVKVFSGHKGAIQCSAFSLDSQFVATGSWDFTVKVWALQRVEEQERTLQGHRGNVSCVCYSGSDMLVRKPHHQEHTGNSLVHSKRLSLFGTNFTNTCSPEVFK